MGSWLLHHWPPVILGTLCAVIAVCVVRITINRKEPSDDRD